MCEGVIVYICASIYVIYEFYGIYGIYGICA